MMQGSKEGKHANLWGPRAHFTKYDQNSNAHKKGLEFQCLKG